MSELVRQYTEGEAKAFLSDTDKPVGGIVQDIQNGSGQVGITVFSTESTLYRFSYNQSIPGCKALEKGSHVCAARRAAGSLIPANRNTICGKIYPNAEIIPANQLVALVAQLPG